jgi:hypothetical protein
VQTENEKAVRDPIAEANNEWIDWAGGDCPVPPDTLVEVELMNGHKSKSFRAGEWDWSLHDGKYNIIRYRVVSEAPASPAPKALKVPNTDGWVRELLTLLVRNDELLRMALLQLKAWQEKYGDANPAWLPPAGDVHVMEAIANIRAINKAMLSSAPKATQQQEQSREATLVYALRAARPFVVLCDNCGDEGRKETLKLIDAAIGNDSSPATPTATASQESTSGQEPVAPIGYIDRLQLERWERLRGTEFEVQERAYIGFSTKPFTSEMTDCTLAVYLAPPTSTAIAKMVIKQAAEVCKKLESDLIELATSGFEHSIHDALEECAARISALIPANAEAELEALMMKVANEAWKDGLWCGKKDDISGEPLPAIVRRVKGE